LQLSEVGVHRSGGCSPPEDLTTARTQEQGKHSIFLFLPLFDDFDF